MSVNTIDYAGPQPTASAQQTADTKRGPTDFLWAPVPTSPGGFVADFIQDPSLGMHFFDDFLVTGSPGIVPALAALTLGSNGGWAMIAPAGGGIGDAGIVGGGISMFTGSLANSSTNQNTAAIFGQVGSFQISKASSATSGLQGKLVFEARVALTSITNGKRDAFIGLIDQAPSSSAAAMALFPFTEAGSSTNSLTSTYNLIGFYFPSASYASSTSYGSACPSGDCSFVFQLASATGISTVFCKNLGGLISNVTGTSIAVNTFYKLGFVYDPQAPPLPISVASDGQTVGNTAKAMLKVYVNGIQAAAFETQTQNILTSSFPTGIMGPIAAISPTSSGTGNTATNQAGALNVDWIRVAQQAIA